MHKKALEIIIVVVLNVINSVLFFRLDLPNPFQDFNFSPHGVLCFQIKSLDYPYTKTYYEYDLKAGSVSQMETDIVSDFTNRKEWVPLTIKSNSDVIFQQGVWRIVYQSRADFEIVYYEYQKPTLVGTSTLYKQYFWKKINTNQAMKIHLPPQAEIIGWKEQ